MRRNIFILLLLCLSLPIAAQEPAKPEAPAAPAAPSVVTAVDSSETREQFRAVLQRLPPQVGKALKLDPTLFNNQPYLAAYPELAQFVAQHPEVPHSPQFFLESVWIPNDHVPEPANVRIWNSMMEMIAIFMTIVTIAIAVTWLIRTVVEHRRWSRVAKVQAEVHNKLLDRFATNEDLLAYVNTSAGRRFLESAPLALDAAPRTMVAPVGRVLWSVQAGVVLAFLGFGMQFVSWGVEKELGQPMSAIGVLAIAVGMGLLISASAAFIVSRKLGVWRAPDLAETAPAAND